VPLAGVLSSLVDLGIGFLILIGLMVYYGLTPTPAVLLLPVFLLLAMGTSLGVGLWLSALNVRYRDVSHLIPFLVRSWMYVTPVIYGSTLIPERYRFLLGLNPMTGVVEGFRWALLGRYVADARPSGVLFVFSIVITFGLLVSGLGYFQQTEDTFADII
jgi:lipopolysaccharide transport system permease protein